VADIGIITVDHDLAAAGDIQAADAFEVSGHGGGLVWSAIGGLPRVAKVGYFLDSIL